MTGRLRTHGYRDRGLVRRPRLFAPRWARTGSEPRTARSALGLRLLLSSIFLPVFLAGTGLLWYWTVKSGPQDVPSDGSLGVLTAMCAAVALFALADLLVVLARRRREWEWHRGPGDR